MYMQMRLNPLRRKPVNQADMFPCLAQSACIHLFSSCSQKPITTSILPILSDVTEFPQNSVESLTGHNRSQSSWCIIAQRAITGQSGDRSSSVPHARLFRSPQSTLPGSQRKVVLLVGVTILITLMQLQFLDFTS